MLYSAHGLTLRSDDIPMDAREAPSDSEVDVVVSLAARSPAAGERDAPAGKLMAKIETDEGRWLSVVRRAINAGGGVDIHFHGVAAVHVDAGCRAVEFVLDPAADDGLASVLLNGTVMSVLLILRGHPVLHASAVTVTDQAGAGVIAFVGNSGMGKSTIATLACRDGAELLADDVLRTDVTKRGVVAWPGSTATRLRPQASGLVAGAGFAVRSTADGRYAASLHAAPGNEVRPLLAIVVPVPDRQIDTVSLERLSGVDAMLMLAAFPRIEGWVDTVTARQAHHHWARLARLVPNVVARVPWGPPFAAGLGREVINRVLAC